MEERDYQTIEEILRFCKVIDKCMDIDYKHQLKSSSHRLEKKKEKEMKLATTILRLFRKDQKEKKEDTAGNSALYTASR